MARYFTSDLHLGSTLINKVAHRPFISAEAAVNGLIENINKTVAGEDVLFHVGDFMLSGVDKHGWDVDEGLKYKQNDYLKMIHSRVMLLAGNHDSGHNCDADANCMLLDLPYYKGVTVGHYPSISSETGEIKYGISRKHTAGYLGNYGTASRIHIHLCGHVHQHWFIAYDADNHVLNINVGVDQWNYKPVRDSEISLVLDWLFAYHFNHKSARMHSCIWTRAEFEGVQNAVKRSNQQARLRRKLAKGLTPEECERRKIEAMKAKGLIK